MNTSPTTADVILIGGGIMSATLGSMLAVLKPDLDIVLLERADQLASESSAPWNNAGTGHSGYCELNYMPDPTDGAKPALISDQFQTSLAWWHYLEDRGLVDTQQFLHDVPHLDVVFGDSDVEYLRQRFETLHRLPQFSAMEFTTDPQRIADWAPLVTEGFDTETGTPIAMTMAATGTDVDFGALTTALTDVVVDGGGKVLFGHSVRRLRRDRDDQWLVTAQNANGKAEFRAPFVFVGAGGHALHVLQKARLPEVKGYAVLPVGAAFFRTSRQDVVDKHNAKVYGQAPLGAPPMSVPHLDKRIVDGRGHLMFGPYATFSTKLLKHGRLTDFFTTLRWDNLHVIASAVLRELSLIRYLIGQLAATPRRKFHQLQRYYPEARFEDWELFPAGQRAQLVKPDARGLGALQQGTELVVAGDKTIAGLLGASPGASTAVPIMVELIERCFPGVELPNEVQVE